MVWHNLRIGNFKAKVTSINKKEVVYPDVDENGNELKRVSGHFEKGYFLTSEGNKVERAFKLINGKARDKLQKTKEVVAFKEVSKFEVFNLMSESYYYVECDELQEYLKEKDTAIKFGFTNGNGYKIYVAYVVLFGNALIMFCGQGYLTEQLQEVEEGKIAQKLLAELKGVPKVEALKVEELIAL